MGAETHPGLEQYSINKFAEAFEVVPRVLAENSGVKPKEVISKLYAAHSEGNKNMGFDIDGESGEIKDCLESNVLDLLLAKLWGLSRGTPQVEWTRMMTKYFLTCLVYCVPCSS